MKIFEKSFAKYNTVKKKQMYDKYINVLTVYSNKAKS
jgi:hypothetical protein